MKAFGLIDYKSNEWSTCFKIWFGLQLFVSHIFENNMIIFLRPRLNKYESFLVRQLWSILKLPVAFQIKYKYEWSYWSPPYIPNMILLEYVKNSSKLPKHLRSYLALCIVLIWFQGLLFEIFIRSDFFFFLRTWIVMDVM